MTKRVLGIGLFSIVLFACAGDPNKEANDAHNSELKADRKQEQKEADSRSETRVQAAEAQRGATEATATGTPATKDRTGADAKMTEARDIYRAKATERLEKSDARTSELKAIIDKAGPKATTASRDSLAMIFTQRGLVTRELERLPTVSGDDFKPAKQSLDTQLDTLEGLVKKTATEVDSFKKK